MAKKTKATETKQAEPQKPTQPILLPATLHALKKATFDGGCRYALGGIHIEAKDGRFEAAATDSRILAVVSGPCVDVGAGKDTSSHKNSALTPSNADCIVSPKDLAAAATISRDKQKAVGLTQNCQSVCLVADGARSFVAPMIEGRFPRYRDVIPRQKPTVSIKLNVKLLRGLLDVADAFAEHVMLHLFDADTSAMLETSDVNGVMPQVKFTGLIMPISERTSK